MEKNKKSNSVARMRIFLTVVSCLMLVTLSACGQKDSAKDDVIVETESSEMFSDVKEEAGTDKELYSENSTESNSIQYEPNVLEADLTGNSDAVTENSSVQYETAAWESDISLESEEDLYVGKYNDYDVNEPNLEIQKNGDGTYTVQIGIFRLAYMDDGVGKLTENGIEFTATAPNGRTINGIIVLEGDIATVTFTSLEWNEYSSVNEYKYYKTSDIPLE